MQTVNGEILNDSEEERVNSVFEESRGSSSSRREKKQNEWNQNKTSNRKSRSFFEMIKDRRFVQNKSRLFQLAACVVYIISPIDLIPDFILGLGQLDDLVVLGYGMKLIHDVVKDFKIYKALND